MHLEAYEGLLQMIEQSQLDRHQPLLILDVGGQDINSTGQGLDVHAYFTHPETQIVTLDLVKADIIADARTWTPDRPYDVVMSTELFEHCERWWEAVETMAKALRVDGTFLSTCASTRRLPHGAWGEEKVPRGQHYGNVAPEELEEVLQKFFERYRVTYRYPPGDVYAWAQL